MLKESRAIQALFLPLRRRNWKTKTTVRPQAIMRKRVLSLGRLRCTIGQHVSIRPREADSPQLISPGRRIKRRGERLEASGREEDKGHEPIIGIQPRKRVYVPRWFTCDLKRTRHYSPPTAARQGADQVISDKDGFVDVAMPMIEYDFAQLGACRGPIS